MSLAGLAMAFQKAADESGDHAQRIWDMVAFLGRYGSQPADVVLDLSIADMRRLSKGVGRILREESAAWKEGAT